MQPLEIGRVIQVGQVVFWLNLLIQSVRALEHLRNAVFRIIVGYLVELLLQAPQVQVFGELSWRFQWAFLGNMLTDFSGLSRENDVRIELLGGLECATLVDTRLLLALLHVHQVQLLVLYHHVARVAVLYRVLIREIRIY